MRNIKNFRLKDDFQFKYDPPVSPPPQPPHFHKLSSPLADSPLDAGVSLLPHVSHDLIKVEPNIPMSSDSTHKKSKQHSIKSSVTASFLKKKNLFSKDLQLEISNRYKRDYSETRFVRTPGSADNAANSQETTTTNTKERILNSIIPSKEENHIAPAASTPPSSTSVPNSTTTTQEQISLLTKLNRKWNKASVLESLPGTTKNINQNNNSKPRKRSRALLESDTEDYDLND